MSRTVAVIGAGAAGLTAALRAAEAGARVTLLNAHPRVGLKILMSRRDALQRHAPRGRRRATSTAARATSWRASCARSRPRRRARGSRRSACRSKLEDSGKYFPASDDAQTVLDALLRRAAPAPGVTLESGARVVRLERAGGAGVAAWRLGRVVRGDSIRRSAPRSAAVHAAAGRSGRCPRRSPTAGSRPTPSCSPPAGSRSRAPAATAPATRWRAALGHTIVAPVPALTPLTSR